ncbi:hypothetical protein ABKV19_017575 [Rosa sericea]
MSAFCKVKLDLEHAVVPMLNISSQSKVAKLSKKIKRSRGGNQSDEVESLAAATKSALSGSEPSDSIRFTPAPFLNGTFKLTCQMVNALLTQLEKSKSAPNVIILTTSKITAAIVAAHHI